MEAIIDILKTDNENAVSELLEDIFNCDFNKPSSKGYAYEQKWVIVSQSNDNYLQIWQTFAVLELKYK